MHGVLGGPGLSWGQGTGKQVLLGAIGSREEVERPSGTTGLVARRLSLSRVVLEVTHEQRPTEGMASAKALKQERAPHTWEGRPGAGMRAGGESSCFSGPRGPGQEGKLYSESTGEHWLV